MNFSFLYDPNRRVFHMGYNVESGRMDPNYYDLLASEARIASLVAIGRGDVPQEHWLRACQLDLADCNWIDSNGGPAGIPQAEC